MLKLIEMPKEKACSVCCIAMLTGRSFDEVVKTCFGEEPEDFSMKLEQMEQALRDFGLKTVYHEDVPEVLQGNMLIECFNKIEEYWHYVVYDAERAEFLDPIPDPPPTNEYEFCRAIEVTN